RRAGTFRGHGGRLGFAVEPALRRARGGGALGAVARARRAATHARRHAARLTSGPCCTETAVPTHPDVVVGSKLPSWCVRTRTPAAGARWSPRGRRRGRALAPG